MEKEIVYYNQEIKERFINSYKNDDSKTAIASMMKYAKKTEENYKKDLYDMTVKEIEDVLFSLACATPQSVYQKILRIENYIDWAIDNGYRKMDINLLRAEPSKFVWAEKFVSNRKNHYFKKEEVIDMVDLVVNEVDKAIVLSLFEGIGGLRFSELLNLKISDVEFDGYQHWVNLKDENKDEPNVLPTYRRIPISSLLANLLERAQSQVEYRTKNGETKGDNRHKISEINKSEFIINKMKKGVQEGRPGSDLLTRRFKEFKKIFGYKHLNADHFKKSGIMNMAHELQEDGVLSIDSLDKIAIQYDNFDHDMSYAEKYRSYTRIKKIINVNFEKVYEYEISYSK